MNGRKIVALLLVAFIAFFVFNNPSDAAHLVKNIQHLLAHLFRSITTFIDSFGN